MERSVVELNVDIGYLPWQEQAFFSYPDDKFIVVPKGRRPGATQGGIHAFIDWAIEGISPMLWVDTINGNIDRYVERYAYPILKQIDRSKWKWNQNKKTLHILNSVIDFRSADAPESIEGFGYKKIMLNEAGIILKNDYLYNNTILPMLLDYDDSQLFAMGVPKGIHKKDGNEHIFYTLAQRAGDNGGKTGDESKCKTGYRLIRVTPYDNPLLTPSIINELSDEMRTSAQRDQEILGLFVDNAGENPFADAYIPEIHESFDCAFIPNKQLFISVDFNLNPFSVEFSHIWKDNVGVHFHTFDCMEIGRGGIPAMIKAINDKYEPYMSRALMTGDHGGKDGELSQSDLASYFEQLRRGLRMRPSQIVVPGNPTHETSRNDCNYILHHSEYFDVKINPKTAAGVSRDLQFVQCDGFGQIIKRDRKDVNQRADFLDCWRYTVNTFLKREIVNHMKTMSSRRG